MSKTKVKLDAICAKLKESLAQPGDSETCLEEPQDPSDSLSVRQSENTEKAEPEEQEYSMNNERVEKLQNSLVGTELNGLEDGGTDSIPSSRASTPTHCNNNNPTPTRVLTGASRRKSKKKVSRVDPADFETEPRGPLALSESIEYLSVNRLEGNIPKASIISDLSTQGDHTDSNTSMHTANGYRDKSRVSTLDETPQDLSLHTAHHEKEHVGTGIARKSRKRYTRDSYDPLAIANFAERSDGHEESDLLIDEEGEADDEEKEEDEASNDEDAHRAMAVRREGESYPTEPEDLSMPKPSPHQRGPCSPPISKDDSSTNKVNGVTNLNNNNIKEKAMYDTAAVREYAANTMKEFLGMYGYEDDHRVERDDERLDNFAFGEFLL